MKNNNPNNLLADMNRKLSVVAVKLRHYSLALFLVFVVTIYGLVIWRVNTLLTATPTPGQISSQVKANSITKVDPAVVKQLQTLRDNSVNVQVLFDQGRNNPFQ
jgi:hypothetical protein